MRCTPTLRPAFGSTPRVTPTTLIRQCITEFPALATTALEHPATLLTGGLFAAVAIPLALALSSVSKLLRRN